MPVLLFSYTVDGNVRSCLCTVNFLFLHLFIDSANNGFWSNMCNHSFFFYSTINQTGG